MAKQSLLETPQLELALRVLEANHLQAMHLHQLLENHLRPMPPLPARFQLDQLSSLLELVQQLLVLPLPLEELMAVLLVLQLVREELTVVQVLPRRESTRSLSNTRRLQVRLLLDMLGRMLL